MYTWISDVGNPFLTSSNSVGSDASGAQSLLSTHDQFEGDANGTYTLASLLFARGKELSSSGECNPDMIEEAAESLETAVSVFATRLDERREIILHSQDYHRRTRAVSKLTNEDGRLGHVTHHLILGCCVHDVVMVTRLGLILVNWTWLYACTVLPNVSPLSAPSFPLHS